MSKDKLIACVIPARLCSSRFPRKILAPLSGKPLIQWVWEAAGRVKLFDRIVFAIDAEETARVIEGFGGAYVMTSPECQNGTERLAEIQARGVIQADIWVNWQADEPLLCPEMLDVLLKTVDDPKIDVWTLKKRLLDPEEIESPHVVKVVCDGSGKALYFSRSTIPHYRDALQEKIYYKHCGLYAYTDAALKKMGQLSPCPLARAESLEQLTFLTQGFHIHVAETEHEIVGVDLPEHLETVEIILGARV